MTVIKSAICLFISQKVTLFFINQLVQIQWREPPTTTHILLVDTKIGAGREYLTQSKW